MDLTVLAATSVLSDLSDKCPPAEACRDAFERMSKATIKMCMSTTGFGSQVKFATQHTESPVMQHHFERQVPPPPVFTSVPSRPSPRFDDNWQELFPENLLTSDGRNAGGLSGQWQKPTQSNLPFATQRPSFSLSETSTLSNGTNTILPLIANSQQARQPQSQYDPSLMSQSSTTLADNGTSMPDYGMFDFDFLMNNDNLNTISGFTGDSGLNLGFDSHHDWADGGNAQLPDLFGGFFFGGTAGDGTAMDDAAGYPSAGDFADAQSSGAGSIWSGGQEQ